MIGWGSKNHKPNYKDHTLRKAQVEIFDFAQCRKIFHKNKIHYRRPILSNHVCAGPPQICVVSSESDIKHFFNKHLG